MPTTRLGWWAVRLVAADVLLTLPVVIFPGVDGPDILGALCGLIGGIIAVRAILRDGDRAVLVFLAVLPLLFYLALMAFRAFVSG